MSVCISAAKQAYAAMHLGLLHMSDECQIQHTASIGLMAYFWTHAYMTEMCLNILFFVHF